MSKKELTDICLSLEMDERITIRNFINNHIIYLCFILKKVKLPSDIIKYYVENYTYYLKPEIITAPLCRLNSFRTVVFDDIGLTFKLEYYANFKVYSRTSVHL